MLQLRKSKLVHQLTNAAKNIGADLQVFAKTEDALLWGPDIVLLHSYQDAKLFWRTHLWVINDANWMGTKQSQVLQIT